MSSTPLSNTSTILFEMSARALRHRASQLEERLVVVPHQARSKSVDFHRARRIQNLAARMQALLDQLLDARRRQLGAYDYGLGVGFADAARQLVHGAEKAFVASVVGGKISDDSVVTARSADGVLESPRLLGRSYQERTRCPSLPRPDVLKKPLGDLADEQQANPQRSGGGDEWKGDVRQISASNHPCPVDERSAGDGDEEPDWLIERAMAAMPAGAEDGDQRHDREEDHAAATGHERRRSAERQPARERFRAGERFGVEPQRDRPCQEDGDDVARDEHGEAGRHARRVPPKRQRASVAQRRAALEPGVREDPSLVQLWYG